MTDPGRENKRDSTSERARANEHSSDSETDPALVPKRQSSDPRTEQAESIFTASTSESLNLSTQRTVSLSDKQSSMSNGFPPTSLLGTLFPLMSSSESGRGVASENDGKDWSDETHSGSVPLSQPGALSPNPDESDQITKRIKKPGSSWEMTRSQDGDRADLAFQEAETTRSGNKEDKPESDFSFLTSDNWQEDDREISWDVSRAEQDKENERDQLSQKERRQLPCFSKEIAHNEAAIHETQNERCFTEKGAESRDAEQETSSYLSNSPVIDDDRSVYRENYDEGTEVNHRETAVENPDCSESNAFAADRSEKAASALPRFARLERVLLDGSTCETTLSSALASLDRGSVVRIISCPVFASLCATAVLVQMLRRHGLRFEVRFGVTSGACSGALLEFSGYASFDIIRPRVDDCDGAFREQNNGRSESCNKAEEQKEEIARSRLFRNGAAVDLGSKAPLEAKKKGDRKGSLGNSSINQVTFRLLSQTRGSRCVCASLGGLFLLAEAAVAADAADLAVLWPCAIALEHTAEIAAAQISSSITALEHSTRAENGAPGESGGCRRCFSLLPNWLRRQIALCEPETGLSSEKRTVLLFARNAPIASSISSSIRTLFSERLFKEKNYARLNEVLALAGISIGSGYQTYIGLGNGAKRRIDERFGLVERFVLRLGHDMEICGSEHAILIIRQLAAGRAAEAFFLLSQFEQRSVLDMEVGHRFFADLVAVFRKLISRAASVSGKNMVVFRAKLSRIGPVYDVLSMLWRLCAAYAGKCVDDKSGDQRVLLVLETDSGSESVFFSMNMDVEKLLRGRIGVRCLGRGFAVAEQEMRAQVLRWVLGVERRAAKC